MKPLYQSFKFTITFHSFLSSQIHNSKSNDKRLSENDKRIIAIKHSFHLPLYFQGNEDAFLNQNWNIPIHLPSSLLNFN